MATPVIVTDGDTVFNAANMNKFLSSDGTATSVKLWHARARYNGSSTVIESSVDSAGFSGIAFNSGDTTFDLTLSGFTNPPVAVMTAQGSTSYYPKVESVTNTLLKVSFHNISTGAKIVTGVADTDMDFHIMAVGF